MYLSVNGLLEAPAHIAILPMVGPGEAVAISVVDAVPIPVPIPIAVPWLGALLHRVHPVSAGVPPSGRGLARLDPGHLVDLHLCLRWMLDVHIHQGRVHGSCQKKHSALDSSNSTASRWGRGRIS